MMADGCTKISDEEYTQISMYIPEKINKCINLFAEEYLKDTDLKYYYAPYIVHIHNVDGISQKDLKKLIPFDKSRISVVVRELINMGLVFDNGTGRNSCLHLTDEGRSAHTICKMFMNIVYREIFHIDDIYDEKFKAQMVELNARLDKILESHGQ